MYCTVLYCKQVGERNSMEEKSMRLSRGMKEAEGEKKEGYYH